MNLHFNDIYFLVIYQWPQNCNQLRNPHYMPQDSLLYKHFKSYMIELLASSIFIIRTQAFGII